MFCWFSQSGWMSSELQILLLPLNPLLWFGKQKKRTRRGGGGDVLDFPLPLSQIISVSELNKGGLTAAIATGLFLLHLLLCILTHTAALCPQGLNHLSSLHPKPHLHSPKPPLFYSVSFFLGLSAEASQIRACTWLLTTNEQSLKCSNMMFLSGFDLHRLNI